MRALALLPDSKFRASYRLQLHKDFTFQEVLKLIPYLSSLGISHLYLSPIFESRPGSSHGYDGVDVNKISLERGGEEKFRKVLKAVKRSSEIHGVILDIVPNHMAAHEMNPWWWDVLKNGKKSEHWNFFDFRKRKNGDDKIILPVLGRSRANELAAGNLKLDKKNNEFVIRYWDKTFPLSPESLNLIPKNTKLKSVEQLLSRQNYVLEEWRKGSREINYRRFFDVNDLAGLRMEDEKVFSKAHQKIQKLVEEFPEIHGLRVDHIDGLREPEDYLKHLTQIHERVWVEKILGDGEVLQKNWPIQGSTGYEFSNITSRLFVDLAGVLHLHSHYIRHIDGRWENFHDCVYDAKREMLYSHFHSEVNFLTDQIMALSKDIREVEFSREDLFETLIEISSSLRVYRTYKKKEGNEECSWLKQAFLEVEGRGHLQSLEALEFLKGFLQKNKFNDSEYDWVKRWEQLTGPTMAKGLEDTALYRYFPLLSLNVVGGEPDWTGDGTREFHTYNQERLRAYPLGMSATSTHDTKRSEDVRSRIHVLSELSEEWTKFFEKAYKKTQKLKLSDKNRSHLDIHTLYLVYETLLGAWPLVGSADTEFIQRMKNYFIKATREAKTNTSWTEQDSNFEENLLFHVEQTIKPVQPEAKKLQKEFLKFTSRCAYFGCWNSLSLLTLKCLSPGLPDFYQGTEMWDLSLVDPDNRRPVDFELRKKLLKKFKSKLKPNLKNWKTGEIKLWLTWRLLQLKKQDPELFILGDYRPIELTGSYKRHFIAFMRSHENRRAFVLVPRLLSQKQKAENEIKIKAKDLSKIPVPDLENEGVEWTNALTNKKLQTRPLNVGEILDGMPVGVLIGLSSK